MNAAHVKSEQAPVKITEQMRMIREYIANHDHTTEGDLADLLDLKRTRIYLLTRQMANAGLIKITGRGKTKRYTLN